MKRKSASLRQIADRAGVSVTAVSLVLNLKDESGRVSEDCANRIRAIARDVGYTANYHARSMKLGRAEAIALALDLGFSNSNDGPVFSELAIPYFAQIVGSIECTLRTRGYQMTVVGPTAQQRAPDRALQGIRERRFDGMIVQGSSIDRHAARFMAESPELPIVAIDYAGPTMLPLVLPDPIPGLRQAIRHLAELGHRHVLWVGPSSQLGSSQPEPREQQFISTAWEAGMHGHVIRYQIPPNSAGGIALCSSIPQVSYHAMRQRLAAGPRDFTAVVAFNDLAAIGVCNAVLDEGLAIPKDISVIGHDDWEGRFYRPQLTSVDLRLSEVAQSAVKQLVQLIDHPDKLPELRGTVQQIPSGLVVRNSTGPARATDATGREA